MTPTALGWLGESPPGEIAAPPLVLRRYRIEDGPLLAAAVAESFEHLLPWSAWVTSGSSRKALDVFLAREVKQFDEGSDFHYSMNVGEQELVGGCGLHPGVRPGVLEIGYWTHVRYVKRGLATLATNALTTIGLSLPGVLRIEIGCDVANVVSARIPRTLGYRLDRIEERPPSAPGETNERMVWSMDRS